MAKNNNVTPKVAFLIVTWNNREIVDECLKSLQKQTYRNCSIYLIDNASKDDTARYVAAKYPDIHLIASKRNNGFAKGNNILIKKALEDDAVDYIALINSDAVLDENWAQELITYLRGKRMVAAAQGVTLDYYDHGVIDAEHIYMRPNLQSVQFGYGERFSNIHAHPRRVFGVNAAAALYSREFIEQQPFNKLFDEKFFMYLEDVDVSFRALVMGWDNYYVPKARAYHMGSISAKKRSTTFNIEMTLRNQPALLFKNIPLITFLRFLPAALRFEREFYNVMKEHYGVNAARRAKWSRVKGVTRLPLFLLDRYRIMKARDLSAKNLERIMRNDGIV